MNTPKFGFVAGAWAASVLAALSVQAQGLGTWTPTGTPNTNNWAALAASADGSKLFAASYDDPAFNPGPIYVSTNSGATWQVSGAPLNFWWALASSTNGEKLVAAVLGESIYTSTNAGASWTQCTNAPQAPWFAVASSWDGEKLVAVSGGTDRSIYTSTNAGLNWVSNNVPHTEYWYAVASSADGNQLVAASNSNTNGGAGAI